jgi:uncharacterized damage-inducible protein DinB
MIPEIKAYLETLDELRSQVANMIKDLPPGGLSWRPSLPAGADGTNSLAVLAVHVAGSEHGWIAETLGGFPQTRVREAEFMYVADSPKEGLDRLAKVAEATSSILGNYTAEQLEGTVAKEGRNVPIRWIIHHVIYHYSLHIGHMQLTYQLWNKGMAATSPRWFDRIPKSAARK